MTVNRSALNTHRQSLNLQLSLTTEIIRGFMDKLILMFFKTSTVVWLLQLVISVTEPIMGLAKMLSRLPHSYKHRVENFLDVLCDLRTSVHAEAICLH